MGEEQQSEIEQGTQYDREHDHHPSRPVSPQVVGEETEDDAGDGVEENGDEQLVHKMEFITKEHVPKPVRHCAPPSSRQSFPYLFGNRLDDVDRDGIAELSVQLDVRLPQDEAFGKPLQPCPFPWGHLADVLPVYPALDAGDRDHAVGTVVNHEIPFPSHAPAHYRARYTVKVADDVTETVPLGQVPRLVPSDCGEGSIGEVVFRRYRSVLKDVADTRFLAVTLGENEFPDAQVLAEGDDVNPFPVLRKTEILGVQDFLEHIVADVGERLPYDAEGVPPVMDDKPLDILAENHLWLVVFADAHHFKEQVSSVLPLEIVIETAVPARHAERLARETRKADVKRRYVPFGDFRYIPRNGERIPKIGFVGLLGILVPFGHEHGRKFFPESPFEAQADTADTGEKVNASVFHQTKHSHYICLKLA